MKQISTLILSLSLMALGGCGGGPGAQVPATDKQVTTTNEDENTPPTVSSNPVTLLTLGSTDIGVCGSSGVSKTDLNVSLYNIGLFTCKLNLNDLKACPLTDLRAWIGHSGNGLNTVGFPREQAFAFTNLTPDQVYSLKVYILGNIGTHTTKAYITEQAQIISGSSYTFNQVPWTCLTPSDAWEIKFKSSGTSATVKLSNDLTAGSFYFYPDLYVLTKL